MQEMELLRCREHVRDERRFISLRRTRLRERCDSKSPECRDVVPKEP